MSRLYTAFTKHNKGLAAAEPKSDDAVEDSSVYRLPPLLLDISPGVFQEVSYLYRNLFILTKGELGSMMICSDQAGAGTSMIALNLAAYAVQNEGIKTLFVEANFRRPLLFKFQPRGHRGFSELLAEQGLLQEYALPTAVPGLSVTGAGKITHASESLLTENRLRYVLTECKAEYSLVIIDAAPINDGAGTLELAKVVDGVVMVTRANALAEEVDRAKAALENVQANIVGVIYNQY